jgi:SSS family solute:Na+ symporter
LLTFGYVKYIMENASTATLVASPVIVSSVLFIGLGLLRKKEDVSPEVAELVDSLNSDIQVK